jgi:hypothetical protein
LGGDYAKQLETKPTNEVVDKYVDILKMLYGKEKVTYPVKYKMTKWFSDEFALGAYSYPGYGEFFLA